MLLTYVEAQFVYYYCVVMYEYSDSNDACFWLILYPVCIYNFEYILYVHGIVNSIIVTSTSGQGNPIVPHKGTCTTHTPSHSIIIQVIVYNCYYTPT